VDEEIVSVLSRCPGVPRRKLTVDEYHRMGDIGILTEDDRVELIDGELVEMAPIGSEHIAATNSLTHLLVMAVGDRGIVSVANPVRLSRHTEPQPDFSVLRRRADYWTAPPLSEDTMLAVEVSNTSLDYDRKVKLALYAGSGIPEVWIVDLAEKRVEVHRGPDGDTYVDVGTAGRSDVLTIAVLPGVSIPVAGIFS
jgi:Uma2 family endonuclease